MQTVLALGFLSSLAGFFFFKSLTALALNLLILFFVSALFLLLVLKVEFLAISFLIIYVGAIAVLILFGLMVLGVSVKTVSRPMFVYLLPAVFNVIFLVSGLYASILSVLSTRASLTSVLLPTAFARTSSSVWLHDIALVGLALYKTHSSLFLMCGLLLLVAICGIIAMITPTREGWQRLSAA